jgi:hypothetical protein
MVDYSDIRKKSVFIGMGDFQDYGGWVLDTQFIETMGVPYLLAHGLGKTVEDAKTQVTFPSVGRYFVKVYTYDWIAPWKKNAPIGVFNIQVGNTQLQAVFGTEGDTWNWQDGGSIDISEVSTTVQLRDLTGFEGRCGLIFFTLDESFSPPTDLKELKTFCRAMTDNLGTRETKKFDIVICGGGIAGICCALSSARQGLKTALVQDRPVVGGNNSSEVRVWLGGETNYEPYPGIGNIVNELEQAKAEHYGSANKGELYEDEAKLLLLQKEKNIELFLQHAVCSAEVEDNIIKSIEVLDIKNNCYRKLEGKYFVDSTGDASLGAMSGADYEVTTNGHMGMTNFWYIEETEEEQKFPRCPWAIDLSEVEFPGRKDIKDVYGNQYEKSLGCWFWESGCEHDPILKAEYARDTNFRAMYGAWDCLKNVDNSYEKYKLVHSSYIAGKRESRRLLGDIILTKSDVSKGVGYRDGCVPSTWNFDVHYPDRRFYSAFYEGDGFITKDYHERFNRPYFIPYRCLYSRNINNLFMAGRNVSVSHDALGTARVMRTCGMMGEVIGIAAKICSENDYLPRNIYDRFLERFVSELSAIPKNAKKKLVANVGHD